MAENPTIKLKELVTWSMCTVWNIWKHRFGAARREPKVMEDKSDSGCKNVAATLLTEKHDEG